MNIRKSYYIYIRRSELVCVCEQKNHFIGIFTYNFSKYFIFEDCRIIASEGGGGGGANSQRYRRANTVCKIFIAQQIYKSKKKKEIKVNNMNFPLIKSMMVLARCKFIMVHVDIGYKKKKRCCYSSEKCIVGRYAVPYIPTIDNAL